MKRTLLSTLFVTASYAQQMPLITSIVDPADGRDVTHVVPLGQLLVNGNFDTNGLNFAVNGVFAPKISVGSHQVLLAVPANVSGPDVTIQATNGPNRNSQILHFDGTYGQDPHLDVYFAQDVASALVFEFPYTDIFGSELYPLPIPRQGVSALQIEVHGDGFGPVDDPTYQAGQLVPRKVITQTNPSWAVFWNGNGTWTIPATLISQLRGKFSFSITVPAASVSFASCGAGATVCPQVLTISPSYNANDPGARSYIVYAYIKE